MPCASSADLLDGGQHWSLLPVQRKPQFHRNGTHLNKQQGSSPDAAARELGRTAGSHSFVHPLADTGISQSTYGLENKATVGIERTIQHHEEKNTQQDKHFPSFSSFLIPHMQTKLWRYLCWHIPCVLWDSCMTDNVFSKLSNQEPAWPLSTLWVHFCSTPSYWAVTRPKLVVTQQMCRGGMQACKYSG